MNLPSSEGAAIHTTRDFKALYKRLEGALERIEQIETPSDTLATILEILITDFEEDLGFEGGRVYQHDEEENDYVLCCGYGTSSDAPIGYRIPRDYQVQQRALTEGLVVMKPGDPELDDEIEAALGVNSRFAAIAVGEGNSHIIALSIKGDTDDEVILYSLTAVKHVINLKLQQQQMAGILNEARIIQESLLPDSSPDFDGYDIYGSSRPAEIVGGDAYDYIFLSDSLLGVAIADASGHGLPAALLARDIITGLRVGMAEDLKIIKVIERLNRVIHRATLSSKFISLFYGELDQRGAFVYCNAGHNRPMFFKGDSFTELGHGGLVLGPNPNARYEAGRVAFESGDLVVMYTDGVTESVDRTDEQFGEERLRSCVEANRGMGSKEIVEAIYTAIDDFADGIPHGDDITVVALQRL